MSDIEAAFFAMMDDIDGDKKKTQAPDKDSVEPIKLSAPGVPNLANANPQSIISVPNSGAQSPLLQMFAPTPVKSTTTPTELQVPVPAKTSELPKVPSGGAVSPLL